MEKFERVFERRGKGQVPIKHMYQRLVRKAEAEEWRLIGLYGILTDWQGKRRKFPLGTNLPTAKEALALYEARNVKREDFAADKIKPDKGMTIAAWADQYFQLEEVKQQRSDKRALLPPLKRLLGKALLTDLEREDLFGYLNQRRKEFIVRRGKITKHPVGDGQIRNELALLSKMRNTAIEHGLKASMVSFKGILPKVKGRDRVLSETEEARLFPAMPKWLYRPSVWSLESCLSEADLVRLTEPMMDEDVGVVTPEGGRKKTGVRQVAPLTPRMREILAQIRAERKHRKVSNVLGHGLVFTREDGSPITKSQIANAMARACAKVGIKNFHFHDLRHTAKTRWARSNKPVEAAMLAAGHSSVEMHNHYVHLRPDDISRIFGTGSVPRVFPESATSDGQVATV
jgi:integrase